MKDRLEAHMARIIAMSTRNPLAQEIADLAFQFWVARAFRGGSLDDDFLRAVLEVTAGRNSAPVTPRLFLVRATVPARPGAQSATL